MKQTHKIVFCGVFAGSTVVIIIMHLPFMFPVKTSIMLGEQSTLICYKNGYSKHRRALYNVMCVVQCNIGYVVSYQ